MKHYYRYIVFLSLLFTLFSCKKLINIEETDYIDESKALKTIENCEQATMGAYSGLQGEGNIILNSMLSDEVKTQEFYNTQSVHEWSYSATDIILTRDVYDIYSLMYTVIDRVNRVLKALPNADSTRPGDEQLRLRLQGEALFIRAYCHFELFRWYCKNYDPAGLGLPYMKSSSLAAQARIDMDDYFKNIQADVNDARPLLPNDLSDVGRVNRMAAAGLQARIALYMRDWSNAITYSTEFINAIPLADAASFKGIWQDANNKEVAFKLKRTATLNPGRLGTYYMAVAADATHPGTVYWGPSSKLWNSYDQVKDIRFSAYVKDEPLIAADPRRSSSSHIVTKYAGTGYGTTNENVADVKVFRTGEMYLIRAEAKAESNDLAGAVSDLNTLDAARITGYTPVSISSKDDVISAIMTERFKELAFEGHRFGDLKRRNWPVVRLAIDAPPNAIVNTLPAGNFRFVMPVPYAEIQANRLMKQNDGY